MKYTKKPVTIEAFQFDLNAPFYTFGIPEGWIKEGDFDFAEDNSYIIIPTLEGNHKALPGDYIIKGVKGEFYPCKPDIFDMTYDRV